MTEILTGMYSLMNLQARGPIARLVILAQHENNYLDIQDNYFLKDLIQNQNEWLKKEKQELFTMSYFIFSLLLDVFTVISTKQKLTIFLFHQIENVITYPSCLAGLSFSQICVLCIGTCCNRSSLALVGSLLYCQGKCNL